MSDEDNLDAFLDFIDADPEYDSEDEPSTSNVAGKTTNGGKKQLSFEDVFGSPIKKKACNDSSKEQRSSLSKSLPAKSLSESSAQNVPTTSSSSSNFVKGIRKRTAGDGVKSLNFGNGKLMDSSLILDPFSKLRLFKTSITLYTDELIGVEDAIKDRNMGIHYVNLMSFKWWYNCSGGKDQKNFSTGGVVVKKQNGVRKSANGNDYTIWEINNLVELDKSWTVFLFGTTGASPSLASVAIGSYIDLVSPSIMDSPSGLKFSVNNVNQIKHIGTAKDFGYCQSKRKDGKPCTLVVNTAECNVCIHHASGELKKFHAKAKSRAKGATGTNSFVDNSKNVRFSSTAKDGVITTNFGKPPVVQKPESTKLEPKNVRMSLQGQSCNTVKRNPVRFGNHESISFAKEKHEFLEKEPPPEVKSRMNLNLDPLKTRHLTDKDRKILEALGGPSASDTSGSGSNLPSDIPAMIAANPNAGGRNFMQYLNRKQFQLDNKRASEATTAARINETQTMTMTRDALVNMKKALHFVKKNGPLNKPNPNSVAKKRKLSEVNEKSSVHSSKNPKRDPAEIDPKSEEYLKILNAKSVHADLLDELKHEEYFEQLEKKEAIEKKLLSTFSIATNAVMCRACKYVALSQSDFCKEQRHQIRIVKATKRFFKCKDCGNRAMSLDRLPKRPCSNCNSSSWETAPVGKEKTGPILPTEKLCIRGDEEKFLGSAGAKMFL